MSDFLSILQTRLQARIDEQSTIKASIESLLTAPAAEARDLTEGETSAFAEARDRFKALDTEIAELRVQHDDLAAIEARAADTAKATPSRGGAVVRAEARMYSKDSNREGRSFFQDAFLAEVRGDYAARERITRHLNEVRVESRAVTTAAFGALVVPQYLIDEYAENLFNGRPTANVVRSVPLPDEGETFTIPRGTTAAATAEQTTQNTAVQNTDYDETDLTVSMFTIAGQQDVSRQSLERGRMVDSIIFGDLANDYAVDIDVQVISRASVGLLNQAGVNAVTYTDASPTLGELWPKLQDAIQRVNSNRKQPATVAVMHPRRWGWLLSQLDSTGRPLISGEVPTNAMGLGTALGYGQVVGSIGGYLPVVTDANIPTNLGTNEDAIIIMRASDQILMERAGDPQQLRFEQTTGGSLTTKLVLYGYAAFTAGRYPTSVSVITGTGLIAPTF
jgi:HK97 family phage major capsid protein